MSSTNNPAVSNPGNFLRTSRNFPADIEQLSVEVSRSYIDIARQVNNRISGIYGLNSVVTTGESWFLDGETSKRSSLRQVYAFTGAGNIPHNIEWSSLTLISPKSYGTYTNGTNWYGVAYASSVAIAGQVTFYVTPTNIVVQAGGGAPVIVSGVIVIEWISQK